MRLRAASAIRRHSCPYWNAIGEIEAVMGVEGLSALLPSELLGNRGKVAS